MKQFLTNQSPEEIKNQADAFFSAGIEAYNVSNFSDAFQLWQQAL